MCKALDMIPSVGLGERRVFDTEMAFPKVQHAFILKMLSS
jgi:hypothetical protein